MSFIVPNLENTFSYFSPGTEDNSDLMTIKSVTVMQVLAKILSMINAGKLENNPETVVSIVDGTHGDEEGTSAFSYMPFTRELKGELMWNSALVTQRLIHCLQEFCHLEVKQ